MSKERLDMANMRLNYSQAELLESDVCDDPIDQFEKWMKEAMETPGIGEANAMTLATASANGIPNCRIVLLKGFDKRGFVFYTNYESQKGRELSENPNASLLFYWNSLQRQIKIHGSVVKVSDEESDSYFAARPFGSRLAAAVSKQSEIIPGKKYLTSCYEHLLETFPMNSEIPRPSTWGGYRVIPRSVEFWQGGKNRLHDRLLFLRSTNNLNWTLQRLSP